MVNPILSTSVPLSLSQQLFIDTSSLMLEEQHRLQACMDSSNNSSPVDSNSQVNLADLVSIVLTKIIDGNKAFLFKKEVTAANGQDPFLKFQSSYEPEITIPAYLERVRKYSKCSDSCFILMLIYIDRLIEQKSLIITKLNIHRLLIANMMLAAKYHDDLFYNNAYYAKLGGLTTSELNSLELEILTCLNYSMFVSQELYEKYYQQLLRYQHLAALSPLSWSPTTTASMASVPSPPLAAIPSFLSYPSSAVPAASIAAFHQPFPAAPHHHAFSQQNYFYHPSSTSSSQPAAVQTVPIHPQQGTCMNAFQFSPMMYMTTNSSASSQQGMNSSAISPCGNTSVSSVATTRSCFSTSSSSYDQQYQSREQKQHHFSKKALSYSSAHHHNQSKRGGGNMRSFQTVSLHNDSLDSLSSLGSMGGTAPSISPSIFDEQELEFAAACNVPLSSVFIPSPPSSYQYQQQSSSQPCYQPSRQEEMLAAAYSYPQPHHHQQHQQQQQYQPQQQHCCPYLASNPAAAAASMMSSNFSHHFASHHPSQQHFPSSYQHHPHHMNSKKRAHNDLYEGGSSYFNENSHHQHQGNFSTASLSSISSDCSPSYYYPAAISNSLWSSSHLAFN